MERILSNHTFGEKGKVHMPGTSVRDRLHELIPNQLFSPTRFDRDLVADFFMLFARAEFALKRAAFASQGSADRINVEWDRFAKSLGRAVVEPTDPRLVEAVKYLQENPPRKQIFKNGRLEWKDRKPDAPDDPVFLIRSITTVRNNLFHGGKEIVGLMAERDRQLLQNSLLLLAHCLKLNPAVLEAFGELGPEVAVA